MTYVWNLFQINQYNFIGLQVFQYSISVTLLGIVPGIISHRLSIRDQLQLTKKITIFQLTNSVPFCIENYAFLFFEFFRCP